MSDWYILRGHEVVQVDDLVTWGRWMQNARTDRIVAKTGVGPSTVSTVFLGLDHSFGDGKILVFETMVFNGPLAEEMQRYSTWDEAEAGHAAMCERVRGSLQ